MTLKEALRVILHVEHLGDMVYTVRDRAVEDDHNFRGNSWEHPRVKAFSEAVKVLKDEYQRLS